MPAHDLNTRIRTWWAKRQYERKWRKATPAQQMVVLVQLLHESPQLRGMFRDALFGKTHEVRSTDQGAPRGRRKR